MRPRGRYGAWIRASQAQRTRQVAQRRDKDSPTVRCQGMPRLFRMPTQMRNYRNPKLLALANGAPCSSCGARDDTVVAAHSDKLRHGKGRGLKAHDIPAYLCYKCHQIAGGVTPGYTPEERYLIFLEAVYNTWLWLMREDKLHI